jgi:hypothetical protein
MVHLGCFLLSHMPYLIDEIPPVAGNPSAERNACCNSWTVESLQ